MWNPSKVTHNDWLEKSSTSQDLLKNFIIFNYTLHSFTDFFILILNSSTWFKLHDNDALRNVEQLNFFTHLNIINCWIFHITWMANNLMILISAINLVQEISPPLYLSPYRKAKTNVICFFLYASQLSFFHSRFIALKGCIRHSLLSLLL